MASPARTHWASTTSLDFSNLGYALGRGF
jgi:hypothetical protein